MRKIAIGVVLLALTGCSSSSTTSSSSPDTTMTIDSIPTSTISDDGITSSWNIVPSATMPSTTQDVPYQEGIESNIPTDGQYWGSMAIIHGSPRPTAVAMLVKLYAGDACYEYAEQTAQNPEDMCTNDFGVVEYPRALAVLSDLAYVSVITETGSESWPTESYEISVGELQLLVNGGSVQGQPSKYEYVPYPFVFTITDGYVIRAEQVWIP